MGFTMRLNTVSAAIGRVQLKHLDEKNTRRREIVSIYRKNLAQDYILPENKDGKSVYHQIVLKHEKRDEIRKKLIDNEIGSAIMKHQYTNNQFMDFIDLNCLTVKNFQN